LNSAFSKIIVSVVAVLLAAIWLKIITAMDWNMYGLAGAALGLSAGIPLCIGNFTDRRFVLGLLAGAIAVAAFGIGDYRGKEHNQERIRTAIADDNSFIMALAEQKMMYRSPAFGGKPGAFEGCPDGVPMIVDSRTIPDGILKEATAEWNALPEATKQKFREQRVQITQQSFGDKIEPTATLVPWLMKFGMMFVVGMVAFVVASAPAIPAMKR
jgi:hypothetical protein